MTHREPTIHNRALTTPCPHCGSVPGALCYDKRGSRLPDGRVHQRRTAAYKRHAKETSA
ncbi:zinc finger domain-containing protein [Streptomyces sp. NPDC055107]